jgi:hypothetical protein
MHKEVLCVLFPRGQEEIAAPHESGSGTFAPWRWPPEVVSYLRVKQSD